MTSLRTLFGLGDFRRLFAGTTTSALGDQFLLVDAIWAAFQRAFLAISAKLMGDKPQGRPIH